MMKIYCKILGEDFNYVNQFQPSGKRKIALLANCLMVPVILWMITGYLLVHNVLGNSFPIAIFSALIISFIIFLIERAIIMSTGSIMIVIFRIGLGLGIAFLGAISIDEALFKNDIDHKMAEYKKNASQNAEQKIDQDWIEKINRQQAIVNNKSTLWNQALDDAKREADGTGGSKTRNVGTITRLKIQAASYLEKDYKIENNMLESMNKEYRLERTNASNNAAGNFKEEALLLRIEAMFDLIRTNSYMRIVYIVFTIVLVFLEVMVLTIKMCNKKSIDEELELAREELIRNRTQKALSHKLVNYNPGDYHPAAALAKKYMSENNTSVFN
jgi:hypothetical protein